VAGPFSSSLLSRLVSRMNLRYPTLFRILVVVTLLDFFVPDVLPFADEIGLTLLTLAVSQWKNRREVAARPQETETKERRDSGT
jgi:hypothetical protein